MVARVLPGRLAEYKKLHAHVWPGVLDQIKRSQITNYSIYLSKLPDGNHYLFSYFEYRGDDFREDMKAMAVDPTTQKWWAVCKPCLEPTEQMPPGEVWVPMEEIFHCE